MGRRLLWGLMTLGAAVVATYAMSSAFAPTLRTPFVRELIAVKTSRTYGHLLGGGVSLLVGAFQFNRALRDGRPAIHRRLGQIYLLAVVVGGLAALGLAPTAKGGVIAQVGFGLLGIAWLAASAVAFRLVLEGEYDAHRDWMTRSYALCLAAVALRIYLPVSLLAGVPFDRAYPAIAWLCWVPNLAAAEWMIATRRVASSARRADVRLHATRSSP